MKLASLLTQKKDFSKPTLPPPKALASRKEAILNHWPDVVATPPEKDRERLVQEVRRRWAGDQWDDTPMSLITSAARALFDGERRARPDLEGLREFYYAEILASTRQTFLDAMFSVYISTYAPDTPHTRRLASALASVRSQLGGRSRPVLQNIPEILNAHKAPEVIAALMMQMDDCWNGLKQLGLRTPHAPGLMDHAHLAFVDKIRQVRATPQIVEKLFDWLKPEGQSARMSGASEAITIVLAPWLNSDPAQQFLTYLTENLIGLYGDPRVQRGGAWAGVPGAHQNVLMRWLTGENIRFFLDIVTKSEASHMWEPRRRFWLGLHEQKRIDTAWVAFSKSAKYHANRELGLRGSKGLLAFGSQLAGGNRSDTSLLIMQIGDKIVVEGSHDYKVHLFRKSNPSAPRLYLDSYDCEEIREISGAETKKHSGNWQGWVLERI